jgi:hypothetical protein
MISPGQCRAARGLLGWSQTDLSEKSSVSRWVVVKFEGGGKVAAGSIALLKLCLQEKIEFLPETTRTGEGVCLKKGLSTCATTTESVANSDNASNPSEVLSSTFDDPIRGPIARAVFQRGRWFILPRQTRRILRAWLFADRCGAQSSQLGE